MLTEYRSPLISQLIHKKVKKNLILIAVLLSFGSNTKLLACDMCGCSSMGGLNNLSAYATNNFFMFKSSFISFHTFSETVSTDIYSDMYSFDLIAGYSIGKRLHLTGYIPYKLNTYSTDEETNTYQGIGDIGVIANYVLFKNKSSDTVLEISGFNFSVKGGVEIPTGKFNNNFRIDQLPASLSTVSGSVDFIAGGRFIKYKNNTTFLGDYTFKYNLENATMYRFGMQNTLALIVTQKVEKQKMIFTPFAGIIGEHSSFDKFHDLDQHTTSGENIYVDLGCEFVIKKLMAGVSAEIPLYSDFGGEISSNPRYSVRVGYLFN